MKGNDMKYMMLLVLMISNVAYGMDSASNTRTRSNSFDEELRAREESLRRQLEESEKDLPPLTSQTRPRSYTDELQEQIAAGNREIEALRLEREAREKAEPKDKRPFIERLREAAKKQSNTEADQAREHERAAGSADSKRSSAAAQQKEEKPPRLSPQEYQEREAFKRRFKTAYLKSKAGKYLDDYITDECNKNGQGVGDEDIDAAIDMFLIAYGDAVFTPIKQTQHAIQEEFKQCRGGRVGQFAYNFYNPKWQREIVERHHKKVSAEELLLAALKLCHKNAKSVQIVVVLDLINKHFSYKEHEQARLLLREAEKSYRYGIYKFLHAVHMNPRRVFVALAAAAVIIYGSYRYYHRDY
jgi:flagellar biosynthesis GTPase FlhF